MNIISVLRLAFEFRRLSRLGHIDLDIVGQRTACLNYASRRRWVPCGRVPCGGPHSDKMGQRRFWGRNGCMVEAGSVFAGEHGCGSSCLPVLCCSGKRTQESFSKYSQQRSYFDDCGDDWFLHDRMGVRVAGSFDRHEHPQRSVLVLLVAWKLRGAVVDGCAVGSRLYRFSAEFKQYNV